MPSSFIARISINQDEQCQLGSSWAGKSLKPTGCLQSQLVGQTSSAVNVSHEKARLIDGVFTCP